MAEQQRLCDLGIIGAGPAGCALAAALRLRGWGGTITLLEIGRGPGGRAATRRSRSDPALAINHGAPLFNIRSAPEPCLLEPLRRGGWIEPFTGAIHSLDGSGDLGPAINDGFSSGRLWQGRGGMEQVCRGLLDLAQGQAGHTELRGGCLVRQLQPQPDCWTLTDPDGQPLLHCRWLVVSGTLLAHPRCQRVFGWGDVPLRSAAAKHNDPQLLEACGALAACGSQASSNLLLTLPAAAAEAWRQQPWRLLQFTPAAQARWGLRRVSLQPQGDQRLAVVAESSATFAERHLDVYGSRSSAGQLLGAAPEAGAEAAVLEQLAQALGEALQLPTATGDRQLMRWGAAFPQGPGLEPHLQLCPASRIGFCGDAVAGDGFGRVEGALRSAEALAERLLAEHLPLCGYGHNS
jgi:predicted NAD/FAD-dependent oxidoreductase